MPAVALLANLDLLAGILCGTTEFGHGGWLVVDVSKIFRKEYLFP
jgi:hypothetical protein